MHFKSLVATSLGSTAYFDLALSRAALLRVVGDSDSFPIKFLLALWRGWHLPFVVYFYKVYLNTLDI